MNKVLLIIIFLFFSVTAAISQDVNILISDAQKRRGSIQGTGST